MTEPLALDDLFEADPLSLTDDDFQRLVDGFREECVRWVAQGEKGALKKAPKAAPPTNLSLDDLFGAGGPKL